MPGHSQLRVLVNTVSEKSGERNNEHREENEASGEVSTHPPTKTLAMNSGDLRMLAPLTQLQLHSRQRRTLIRGPRRLKLSKKLRRNITIPDDKN